MANASAVRIGTYDNWSWSMNPCAITNLHPRPHCQMPGFQTEVLLAVLTSLSLPYELVPSERNVGFYRDGWWREGLFGALQNGTVDLLASAFVNTEYRRMNFSFSYPVHEIKVVFLTAAPHSRVVNNALLLFEVFGKYVWLVLFTGVLIRMLDFQSCKTIIGVGTILFLNLYACLLLTHLLSVRLSYRVRDIDHMIELIEHKRVQLIIMGDEGTSIDESIRFSKHPIYRQLRHALRHNPILYSHHTTDTIPKVASGRYVAVGYKDAISEYKRYDCSIHVMDHHTVFLPSYSSSFMFRKGFHLLPEFNRALIALQGHTVRLYNKYRNKMDTDSNIKCRSAVEGNENVPLSIVSMSGAFVTLLAVSVTCCLCLAVECIISRLRRKSDPQIEEISTTNAIEEEKISVTEKMTKTTDGSDKQWVWNSIVEKASADVAEISVPKSSTDLSFEFELWNNVSDLMKVCEQNECRQVHQMNMMYERMGYDEAQAREMAFKNGADIIDGLMVLNKNYTDSLENAFTAVED